ncbi:hypothetical protein pb186bvf_009007 [Paramecium bursaria]
MYNEIASQLHTNWNLSQYARNQKDQRVVNKLTQEQLIEVYNNRPPVQDQEIRPKSKAITTSSSQKRIKSAMGVINPEHKFDDPRISLNQKKFSEHEWYAKRSHENAPKQPEDPLIEPQPNLEIHAAKIHLKPPPVLEKEKPMMQDHLVNPYIYIKKIFKKNQAHIDHPDIWDKSTHDASHRNNKQIKATPKKQNEKSKPPQVEKGKQKSVQELRDLQKEKEDRQQFYLQNMRMREFLFSFFKTVNRLIKEKKYNKIIYDKQSENYQLKQLFDLWADHKKLNFKYNQEKYINKDQFVDFLLVIGLDPDKKGDAERFFDYCHDDVGKMPSATSYATTKANDKDKIKKSQKKGFEESDNKKNYENKWYTMFNDQ